jgi:hypothetical protein
MQLDIAEILSELKSETGYLAEGETTYRPSYWYEVHQQNLQPKGIQFPNEYDGGPALSIWCTQLDMPASRQKKLVAEWIEVLPSLPSVKSLWFVSRVPQELFDAACTLTNLEDLDIKWSGIRSLEAIAGLKNLRHFRFGQSGAVESVQPIAKLTQLEWLFIEGVSKDTSLDAYGALTTLIGLGINGIEGKPLVVPTLSPLAKLINLRWLHLGSIRTTDGSLAPLAKLQRLEYLGLPNFFATEEFSKLAAKLPNTSSDRLLPYARYHTSCPGCRKCRTHGLVTTNGSGSKWLCPNCDAETLVKYIVKFRLAQMC